MNQPGVSSSPDDIDDVVRRTKMRSDSDGNTVVATVVDYDDETTTRGRVTLWIELPNTEQVSKNYSIPVNWDSDKDWVRFVEWDDAPWDSDNFSIDDVEGAEIEMERRGGDWVPAIPEYTESRSETFWRTWSEAEGELKIAIIAGVASLSLSMAMGLLNLITLLG